MDSLQDYNCQLSAGRHRRPAKRWQGEALFDGSRHARLARQSSAASCMRRGLVGQTPQTLARFFDRSSRLAPQSTLFNAIVENGKAAAANFPFCTIEPNVGMVTVPDARLQQLSDISKSKDTVRAPGRQAHAHAFIMPSAQLSLLTPACLHESNKQLQQVTEGVSPPPSLPPWLLLPSASTACRSPPLWSLSTLRVWCGVPARVRAWATSSWQTFGRRTQSARWARAGQPQAGRQAGRRCLPDRRAATTQQLVSLRSQHRGCCCFVPTGCALL